MPLQAPPAERILFPERLLESDRDRIGRHTGHNEVFEEQRTATGEIGNGAGEALARCPEIQRAGQLRRERRVRHQDLCRQTRELRLSDGGEGAVGGAAQTHSSRKPAFAEAPREILDRKTIREQHQIELRLTRHVAPSQRDILGIDGDAPAAKRQRDPPERRLTPTGLRRIAAGIGKHHFDQRRQRQGSDGKFAGKRFAAKPQITAHTLAGDTPVQFELRDAGLTRNRYTHLPGSRIETRIPQSEQAEGGTQILAAQPDLAVPDLSRDGVDRERPRRAKAQARHVTRCSRREAIPAGAAHLHGQIRRLSRHGRMLEIDPVTRIAGGEEEAKGLGAPTEGRGRRAERSSGHLALERQPQRPGGELVTGGKAIDRDGEIEPALSNEWRRQTGQTILLEAPEQRQQRCCAPGLQPP